MDKEYITRTEIDFNSRIITKPKFSSTSRNIELLDDVFVFNNGIKWVVIPKNVLEYHPIIHSSYYDVVDSRGQYKMTDISITYCPFSGSCVIYFGKWYCNGSVYKNNIILSKGDLSIAQLPCIECSGEFLRREEVNIMTLRNAIGKYPDCDYLEVDIGGLKKMTIDNYSTTKEIIFNANGNDIDLSNKYHPKSIVYGINYLSKDFGKNKYSVIIPKGTNREDVTGVDINKNGVFDYFVKMLDDVRERGGVIIPVYWFAWMEHFPNSKIIVLT